MHTTTLSCKTFLLIAAAGLLAVPGRTLPGAQRQRPNIVWIVGEDASPHLRCYGEQTIRTPHLDGMAEAGARFTRAFVTNPVCSPSRSAMVTGMYQTTLGAHNHRSQNQGRKAGGNTAFYESYRLPDEVQLVPQLLRAAGYYVTLGSGPACRKRGKTDYNFITDGEVYDGADWKECPESKPFFAQIMLRGGKNRGASRHGTKPEEVQLPPYYPDHPVLRRDWADYLNSWVQMDREVGQILSDLEQAGELEDTVVFFWTDHGVSHLRGKQFLYEEGIRVPLIVRFGDGRMAGKVRDDLVVHVDVAASSLSLAGVPIPDYMQGRDLFAPDYEPREMIFSARDRCDETVDIVRCVRTPRFKYIRNFLSYRPHAQPNQYKDGKAIIRTIRSLHAEGELNELQARPFRAPRPTEELYDLRDDPWETKNLADDPQYAETARRLRSALYDWMIDSRDVGLIPEPILEQLGRRYDNKYAVLQQPENRDLAGKLIEVIEAGESGRSETLYRALESPRASIRYWAATWLGNHGDKAAVSKLREAAKDDSAAVRIAAALALAKLGHAEKYAPVLADHLDEENLISGMYAARALEALGSEASRVLPAIEKARKNQYEFTRRLARRLSAKLSD